MIYLQDNLVVRQVVGENTYVVSFSGESRMFAIRGIHLVRRVSLERAGNSFFGAGSKIRLRGNYKVRTTEEFGGNKVKMFVVTMADEKEENPGNAFKPGLEFQKPVEKAPEVSKSTAEEETAARAELDVIKKAGYVPRVAFKKLTELVGKYRHTKAGGEAEKIAQAMQRRK